MPCSEPVARNESRSGISIEKLGVWSDSVKPPIWKSENEQLEHVFHCASDAAIFIGCSVGDEDAEMAAEPEVDTEATGTSTISASFAAGRKSSTLRRRAKCQQQTPKTTADAGGQPGEDRVRRTRTATTWS